VVDIKDIFSGNSPSLSVDTGIVFPHLQCCHRSQRAGYGVQMEDKRNLALSALPNQWSVDVNAENNGVQITSCSPFQ
jgi:hypothetical protein